ERLSPEEDKELDTAAASLKARMNFDADTEKAMEKFRLFWQIENGNLPCVEPGINLQRNETCHLVCDVDWYEERRTTRRIQYGGPTMRIRLAKGLYWRMGDVAVQRVSEDAMTHIDSGRIFLTNKRIVFMGNRGNKTIRLDKILDFEAFQNGIQIQKDAGKNPFLQFSDGVDVFAMILGRVIRDSS
ncbi:MAG: CheF family chemotaxis protein, partial [bacterium]